MALELPRQISETLEKHLSTKTVIGEPVTFGEVTLIPVMDVMFGLGGGAGEGKDAKGDGGGGAGARLSRDDGEDPAAQGREAGAEGGVNVKGHQPLAGGLRTWGEPWGAGGARAHAVSHPAYAGACGASGGVRR